MTMILIVGVFCVTKPVRKSAVWSKFKQIVGDALTAAAAAISGTSIPFRRYFRTFKVHPFQLTVVERDDERVDFIVAHYDGCLCTERT
jgi:drug/metabolite transporter (DMT)-like permease